MPEHFQRVEENIYRGGIPSPKDLKMLNDIYKIKRVISLDASAATQIAPTLKSFGIEQIVVPLTASETTVTDPLNQLSRHIVNWLVEKQPVYIHCQHGSDRTGFAIGLYRILKDGWTCDQAINEARKFGYGTGLSLATQNLYRNLLCSLKDSAKIEDSDIVGIEREQSHQLPGSSYIPSFAPPTDDPVRKRRIERTKMLQDIADLNDIPLVGIYDNYGPIRGASPIEVQNI